MKQEIPTWAVVVIVVVLLGLIGAWYFSATNKSAQRQGRGKDFRRRIEPVWQPSAARATAGRSGRERSVICSTLTPTLPARGEGVAIPLLHAEEV
jgi:hypothetical protein